MNGDCRIAAHSLALNELYAAERVAHDRHHCDAQRGENLVERKAVLPSENRDLHVRLLTIFAAANGRADADAARRADDDLLTNAHSIAQANSICAGGASW